MDLEKILEWLKKPVASEKSVDITQTETENEVQASSIDKVEQEQEQKQEVQEQQKPQMQQGNQPKNNNPVGSFPGAEYLTHADLHDIAVGRQRFVAKYANFENLNSLLQTIEPIAYRQYLIDIQTGTRKGDYYSYLEKAKDLTLEATKTLSEQLKRLQQYNPMFIPPDRQAQKRPYTVRDMMIDYKKSLPYITTKYHMIYHLDDGSVDRGRLNLSTPSGIQENKNN